MSILNKPKKLFSFYTVKGFFMFSLRIPQARPSEVLNIHLIWLERIHGGSCFELRVGVSRAWVLQSNWVPHDFIRKWNSLCLWLNPFPVYAGWRNYWMVDHVEDWGVKRLRSGRAYLKWVERSELAQDENRFSCYLTDRADYEQYEESKRLEVEDGYRRTSRDYGLEQFEERGY